MRLAKHKDEKAHDNVQSIEVKVKGQKKRKGSATSFAFVLVSLQSINYVQLSSVFHRRTDKLLVVTVDQDKRTVGHWSPTHHHHLLNRLIVIGVSNVCLPPITNDRLSTGSLFDKKRDEGVYCFDLVDCRSNPTNSECLDIPPHQQWQ